jgi:hypothetical protein
VGKKTVGNLMVHREKQKSLPWEQFNNPSI